MKILLIASLLLLAGCYVPAPMAYGPPPPPPYGYYPPPPPAYYPAPVAVGFGFGIRR